MNRELVRLFVILSYLSPHTDLRPLELAQALCMNEDLVSRDLHLLATLPLGLVCEDGRYRLTAGGYKRIVPLVRRSLAFAIPSAACTAPVYHESERLMPIEWEADA